MSELNPPRARPAARLFVAAGSLLLCLCFGAPRPQDANAAAVRPAAVAAAASFNLPPQIFDAPKPGRWPGGTASPAPGDKAAAAPPAPGNQAGEADKPPVQAPAQPQAQTQTRPPVPPGAPPAGQTKTSPISPAGQPGEMQRHGIPLQVIIPPAGSSGGEPAGAPTRPDARTDEAPAVPAPPLTGETPASAVLPGEKPVPPDFAPPAAQHPPTAAPAAPVAPAVRPPAPAGNTAGADVPAFPAAERAAPASAPSSDASPGDGNPAGEVPSLRLDDFTGVSPVLQPDPAAEDAPGARPAPITRPAARPPAPGLSLTDMVVPGVLPELEPVDENSPEAQGFDPGRALGIRDDSTTPLQRFGDVIPNFSSGGATPETDGEQPPFTGNRGPAGQMAY